MKKVIFLDIDGVLNSYQFDKKQIDKPFIPYISELDPDAINLLNQVIDSSTEVIVSSSWRETTPLKKLQDHLRPLPVVNITDPTLKKEESILKYLKENRVDFFVILDDEYILNVKSPLQNHFVKTSYHAGLLPRDIEEIKEKLTIPFKDI